MMLYRRRIALIALVVGSFLLDRLGKVWVQKTMTDGQSIPVIQDVFHITYVYNPGAAFSLFQEHPVPLLILTATLFFVFLFYGLSKRSLSWWDVSSLGLILGGALGNIADRMMHGQVVDFLDFTLIDYPIFNLADAFIFIGIGLFLIQYVLHSRHSHYKLSDQ
jgi:signal peptidase II